MREEVLEFIDNPPRVLKKPECEMVELFTKVIQFVSMFGLLTRFLTGK